MKYYILGISTSLTEIGCYPQIQHIHDLKSLEIFRYHKIDNIGDDFPPINKIDKIKLNKTCKHTNVINSLELGPVKGYFCDLKTSKLFLAFGKKTVKLISTNIDYFLVYKKFDFEIFDYPNSKFIKKEDFVDNEEDIVITSFKNWEKKLDENGDPFIKIIPKKIKLLEHRDWIKFPFGSDNYVSENFKKKFEEEGISGVEFKPSDVEFI